MVLGRHSQDPTGAAVEQIENVQGTTLSATIGRVVTAGPQGANNPDTVTYAPAGWNHVYAARSFEAALSQLDANFDVSAGALVNPLAVVSAWTASGLPTSVKLNGATLVQDVDYFPSVRPCEHELWITLKRSLAGATNRLEIAGAPQLVKGDLSLDARTDRAFWNSTSGAVEFWLMNGANRVGLAPLSPATLAPPWKLAATGDFDADGKPDLFWRNYATQKLSVWTMDGATHTGTLTPTPDQAVNFNWEVVAALDYNADGNRDLLWYNFSSGKIALWIMDASVVRTSGNFTNPANAGDNNWKVYAGGDYGTGAFGQGCTNDIVWRNATSGKVVAWYMDAAGSRTFGTFTTPDGPTADPDGNPTPATDWLLVGPR